MKRILCGLIAAVMVVGLAGCTDTTFDNVKLDSEQTLEELTYKVDSAWERSVSDSIIFYYPFDKQESGFVAVEAQNIPRRIDKSKTTHEELQSYVFSYVKSVFKENENEAVVSFGRYKDVYPYAQVTGNTAIKEIEYSTNTSIILTSTKFYSITIAQKKGISDAFKSAFDTVVESISIDEKQIYENFDAYAMDMEFLKSSCTVLSHGITIGEDGKYSWKLSIENVTDMNGLMVFSSLVGSLLNPKLQPFAFEDGAVKISSVMIDIEENAFITLLPPISDSGLFISTLVARDEYKDKDAIESAYKEHMSDFDFGSILSGLSK